MEKEKINKSKLDKSDSKNSDLKKEESLKEQGPEGKISDLEDKLARAYAEMENQRRRYEKERDDAFEYGGFSFARESLNLIDNLERSKSSLMNDENLKDSNALKKIVEHLDIIQKDMLGILKNNIEPIKSIDQKLDPNLHQAMMEVDDEKKDPGTIVQEIQKGFMMKDRLLRPSLVCVSKTPKKNDETTKKQEKNEENQDKN